jgi:hypothetical protein
LVECCGFGGAQAGEEQRWRVIMMDASRSPSSLISLTMRRIASGNVIHLFVVISQAPALHLGVRGNQEVLPDLSTIAPSGSAYPRKLY